MHERWMLISPPGVVLWARDSALCSCAVRPADGGAQGAGPGRSPPGFQKQRRFHSTAQSCLGSQSCWAAGKDDRLTLHPCGPLQRNRSPQWRLNSSSHVGFFCAFFSFLQVLLSLGASPNYKDRCGLTPLYHTVLAGGDTSCCETLLYYRAMLGTRDENGWDESHQVPSTVEYFRC